MHRIVITTLLMLTPFTVWAFVPTIPEPDVLPLLAVSGIIGLAFYLKKRR